MNPLSRALALAALPLLITSAGCAKKSEPTATGEQGSAATAEKHEFGELSVEQLQAKMDEAKAGKLTLAIFDNNGKDRWQQGHIPGARWVDFKDVQQKDLPADKSATLVFYCANEH